MATNKAEKVVPRRMRTAEEILAINEETMAKVDAGLIDSKTADVRNTIAKNAERLAVKYKLDYLKIYTQAQAKKIQLPTGLLPEMETWVKQLFEDKDDDKKAG